MTSSVAERVYPTLTTSTWIHLPGHDAGQLEEFTTWPLELDALAAVAHGWGAGTDAAPPA